MLPSHLDVRNAAHSAPRLSGLLLVATVLLLTPAGVLRAQQAAGSQISGVVQDSGGLVISEARVTVVQKDTGLSRSTQTRPTEPIPSPICQVGPTG